MIPNGVSSSAVGVEIQLFVAPLSNKHLTVMLQSFILANVPFSLFSYIQRLPRWGAEVTLFSFPSRNGMAALTQHLGSVVVVGAVVVGCRVVVAFGYVGRES
jgi:hypothetical protein